MRRTAAIVICIASLAPVATWAAPDQGRRPECAMTGDCAKADRDNVVICRDDGRCRVAPPNWLTVVAEVSGGGDGMAPGGFVPTEPDPAVVSLPPLGIGLMLALMALFGLHRRT